MSSSTLINGRYNTGKRIHFMPLPLIFFIFFFYFFLLIPAGFNFGLAFRSIVNGEAVCQYLQVGEQIFFSFLFPFSAQQDNYPACYVKNVLFKKKKKREKMTSSTINHDTASSGTFWLLFLRKWWQYCSHFLPPARGFLLWSSQVFAMSYLRIAGCHTCLCTIVWNVNLC